MIFGLALIIIGQRRKDRLRRLLRRVGIASGVVLLALLLSYTAFRRWTLLRPPRDEGAPLPGAAQITSSDGTGMVQVGESKLVRREGIWQLQLDGDPRLMGHSHGMLVAPITARIERHMMRLFGEYVRSPLRQWLAQNLMRWRFRGVPEQIPPRLLVELAAFSRTVVDTEDFPEEPFQRLVFYHALHDMTQRMDGSPLIGCTAFAAWGKQAVDGHLVIGRNFDFEGGAVFDRQKSVTLFRPPGRLPFVSVAWPGMLGVVTGVNARQIYVSINAARTDDPFQPGIPMALLMREILERASTIDEALAVIKEHQVMVAEGILLADGKVPEAVVVELAPRKFAVRRPPDQLLGLTNHFLDARFKGDASNDWLRRYTTSDARYRRVMQLLHRFAGRLDTRTAAMILRNRAAFDDEPLALGNRNALDALIATHGVVVDLTDMMLWVSQGPHLLGPFVALDLRALLGLPRQTISKVEPIPSDPLRDSPGLQQYHQAEEEMRHARALMARDGLEAALEHARRAALLQPASADARKLLGDLLWEAERPEEAKQEYRVFLQLHPPYLRDKEQVRARLGQ